MFDGAAIVTVADAAHGSDSHDAAHVAEAAAARLVRVADPGVNEGRKEVAFVDTSLANYQVLEAGVRAGVAIVEFNGSADGLAQIAQWAQANTGYDAIHIFSHGAEGILNLGAMVLNQAALATEPVKAQLADIGHALNAGGDLLLYGCDIAAGSDGQLLINDIARLTGADVAASIDATGAADKGGNWTLESQVGQIDARFLRVDGYEALMTVATLTASDVVNNSGSPNYNNAVKIIDGYQFLFAHAYNDRVQFTSGGTPSGGIYAANGAEILLIAPTGYTFDFTAVTISAPAGVTMLFSVSYASGASTYIFFDTTVSGANTYSNFSGVANDVTRLSIGRVYYQGPAGNQKYHNFSITDIKLAGNITDGNISITSTGTGLGGAYKIGDTVTARWNNTSSGDNSSGVVAATFDFTQFGGGATVAGTNNNGIWTASYTITAGSIDAVNRNVSVAASSGALVRTATDSTNLTVDNIAPTVTTGRISIAGATGAGGVYKIGDVVTVTWNNTASGDNNSDVISGVKVDFSQFGGAMVAATATGGTWSASYTVTAGSIDAINRTASVTVMDDAGNTTSRNTDTVKVDNVVPTLSITTSASYLAGGETATITFNFSEDPGSSFTWDGSVGDVIVTGGVLSVISGTGLTRTATFTPIANTNSGTASVTVAAGSYSDVPGNSSGPAVTLLLAYDTRAPNAPSVPVMSSASDTGVSSNDAITRNTRPTVTGTAEAGALVILYDTNGVTVLGMAVSDGGGVWSITTSLLSEGTHVLNAAAVDGAGNISPRSGALVVVIDTMPPTVIITSHASSLRSGETATITFSFSEDPGSTFGSADVLVTGGTLSAISGTGLTRTAHFTPTGGINSGTASITVAASSYTDAAGNAGGAGITPALSFDTLAPNAPTAPVMNSASDTGVSNSDNITRNTTPSFTGTAEAGSTVTLYDTDGVTVLGSAVATAGNWSITASVLAEGAHSVTARATDSAGNIGARSTALVVSIDTTPPTLVITSNLASLKSGEAATITFSFSEDPGSTFGSADVLVTGGTLSAITGTGVTRTALFTPTANLNSGTASVTVAAGSYTDAAGNSGGAGATPAISFDTLAPAAPSRPVMNSASDTGVSNSDNITRNTTPSFTGTAEAGATVILYDTNGITVLGSTQANGSGNWSITTSVLGEGIHVFHAASVDGVGNISPRSDALVVVIDTTPPTLVITSNVGSLKSGETATITFSFSEDPGSTFTQSDVAVAGGTLSAITGSGLIRSAIFTPGANLNGGTASITVAASSYTDVAGNAGGAGVTPSLGFDTLAPNAPTAPLMNGASDSGVSNSDNITRNTTPNFSGTAEAGATVTLFDTDGVTVLGTAVATAGNWSITTSVLAEGTHSLTARATDSAGNIGARSTALAVNIDTTPPTVVITSNVSSLKSAETATITFSFSEDPGSTFAQSDVVVSGGTLSAITGAGLIRSAIFTPTDHVGAGTANISIASGSYTDVAGNSGGAGSSPSLSFNTLVPDAPSTPVMNSASDTGVSSNDGITLNTTPTFTGTAEAGATVNLFDTDGVTLLGSAVATGGNWSITTAALAQGNHTLRATATDGSGNVSGLSVAVVVVIDTTPPTLTITSDVGSLKSAETATITFSFSEDPGSTFAQSDVVVSGGTLSAITGTGLIRSAIFTPTDHVGGGTASITVASGSYTDVAGNGGGAGVSPALSFNTLAPDAPTAPVMDSASDTGVSSSDGITRSTTPTFTGTAEAGATVRLFDTDGSTLLGTAVATGGTWSITTTVLTEGSHTLRATATDGSGNVSGLSVATAVVIDTTMPSVSIGTSLASLNGGETAAITFSFSEDPGSTFNWDGSSGDVVVTGGTLSAIAGSGLTRSAIFTPTANINSGTASITLAAGSYTDAAGNAGQAGATPTLTYDTLAPDAPSAPAINGGTNINTTTPTFTGTAEAGSTVTLYGTDGTTVLGSAVAVGGNWTITTAALGEGAHAVRVRATDGAGNISSASPSLAVMVDITPPTVSISSNITTLTAGTTATITFAFSEDPGSSFALADVAVTGGTLSAITGAGLTRTAVFTPTAGIDNGSASIAVVAGSYTDAAGNAGGGAISPLLSVDTLPPDAPSGLTLFGASNNLTNSTTPTITGMATPGSQVTITLYGSNGITVLGTTTTANGTWSIVTAAMTEGTHTLHALSTDTSGNASTVSAGLTITIDITPPTLVITSDVGTLKSGETATITFSFSEDPGNTFSWDGSSGDVVVTGGTLSAISGAGLTRTAHFTPTASINSGTAGITVAASSYTDAAGNAGGAGVTPPLSFDTLAPNAPAAPVMNSTSDTGVSNSDNITSNTSPTFTGTAEAGATVTLYDTDGVTLLGSVVATAGNWSITTSTLAEGAHSLTARATDSAGNIGARSTALVVSIDTTSPTVAITSNLGSLKSGETATITFSFSEDPGSTFSWDGSSGDVVVTGGTLSAISGTGVTRTALFTPTANINSGTASVTVTAGSYLDVAGNAGDAGAMPTIIFDTQAPNVPSKPLMDSASDTGVSNSDNITRNPTPTFTGIAEAGATVTLYDSNGVTVVGSGIANGSGNWSITVSALSEGVHEIDAAVTDSAGNTSGRSSAVSVTIITTAPSQVVTGVTFATPPGTAAGTLVTASTAHTISGALSAPLGLNQSVQVSFDNGVTWSGADAIIGASNWVIDGMLDPAGSTLSVRIADVAGNIGATWSQAYVVDTIAPTVLSVSAPPDGTYSLGKNLDFTVHFSETVLVSAGGNIPAITLTLDTGGTVQATYVSGSGSSDLVFRYTVTNNVQDLTGVTVGAALTGRQQVKDIAGNSAVAMLNAVASTAAVNVDGLDPTVSNVNVVNGSGAYGAGSTITIAVTYDRVVAVDTFNGTPTLALNSGGVATYVSGRNTTTLVFSYTVAAGENATGLDLGAEVLLNGGLIYDAGGIQSDVQLALSSVLRLHANIAIDTMPPATPVIERIDSSGRQPVLSGSALLDSGERLTVTVGGASYNVSVATNGSWQLDLASATPTSGSLALVSGASYVVEVVATDLAGNRSSASTSLQVAAVPPSVFEPVLRPVFSRVLAFMSAPSLQLFASSDDDGSGARAPLPSVSPFALPEWRRDLFLPEHVAAGQDEASELLDPVGQGNLTLGGGFAVTVLGRAVPGAGPVVNQGIRDQQLAATSHTEFFVPRDAFAHGDQRAGVYLTATREDGEPLPYWVSFNPATGKFIIDAKACLSADVTVKVVAHDNRGKAVATQFHIRIGAQAEAGGEGSGGGAAAASIGCIALSEQIRLAAQPPQDGLDHTLARLVAGLPLQEA